MPGAAEDATAMLPDQFGRELVVVLDTAQLGQAEGHFARHRRVAGNRAAAFHPNFEILPGTAPKAPSPSPKPFEVPDLLPPDSAGD